MARRFITHVVFDGAAGEVMSIFVDCESLPELESVFASLSEGGEVFTPLDDYGFSEKFGGTSDRLGVSWQLNLP